MKSPKDVERAPIELIDAIERRSLDALQCLLLECPIDALTLCSISQHFRALGAKDLQRNAANKRHATTTQAKKFVLEYMGRNAFRFPSKIKFCRDASVRVFKRFGLEVKPQTISRDWLPSGVQFGCDPVVPGAVSFSGGRFIRRTLSRKK